MIVLTSFCLSGWSADCVLMEEVEWGDVKGSRVRIACAAYAAALCRTGTNIVEWGRMGSNDVGLSEFVGFCRKIVRKLQ